VPFDRWKTLQSISGEDGPPEPEPVPTSSTRAPGLRDNSASCRPRVRVGYRLLLLQWEEQCHHMSGDKRS